MGGQADPPGSRRLERRRHPRHLPSRERGEGEGVAGRVSPQPLATMCGWLACANWAPRALPGSWTHGRSRARGLASNPSGDEPQGIPGQEVAVPGLRRKETCSVDYSTPTGSSATAAISVSSFLELRLSGSSRAQRWAHPPPGVRPALVICAPAADQLSPGRSASAQGREGPRRGDGGQNDIPRR